MKGDSEMISEAVLPRLITSSEHKILMNVLSIIVGILFISALAQVIIPLPWTPVPITGQTFGVTLVSLLWGWKRAGTVLFLYVSLGGLGLPLFAHAKSGLISPTVGYLIGMVVGSFLVGYLSDKGMTLSFKKAFLAACMGSLCVFGFGVLGLSYFVPSEGLLVSGVLPFLPGDILKNGLAAYMASTARRQMD